jgi:hypothetical protein
MSAVEIHGTDGVTRSASAAGIAARCGRISIPG